MSSLVLTPEQIAEPTHDQIEEAMKLFGTELDFSSVDTLKDTLKQVFVFNHPDRGRNARKAILANVLWSALRNSRTPGDLYRVYYRYLNALINVSWTSLQNSGDSEDLYGVCCRGYGDLKAKADAEEESITLGAYGEESSNSGDSTVDLEKYSDVKINFETWKVCKTQEEVNEAARSGIYFCGFGTKEPEDDVNQNRNTLISDMCGSETVSFTESDVVIPQEVRHIAIGKLEKKEVYFRFEKADSKWPTVKLVENKDKNLNVNISLEQLTLPPNAKTFLNIAEGVQIEKLECDPEKVFVMQGGERKSLSELLGTNNEVQLDNGITLQKANDTNKNFNFIIQKSGGRG